MFFLNTNSASPYAIGRITERTYTKSFNGLSQFSISPAKNVDPFLKEIDIFGKLEGNFNNLPSNEPFADGYSYYTNHGSDEIAHNYLKQLRRNSKRPFPSRFAGVEKN